MARHLRRELEAEADRKGLSGERKEAYVGGAYQRITHGQERRSFWVQTAEHKYLARVVGEVAELRQPKSRPDVVVFRQRSQWYELPALEYMRLVKAGKAVFAQEERDRKAEEKERRREDMAVKLYYRELELERKTAELAAARSERSERRQRDADQAALRAVHRAEYGEVVRLLRSVGGVKLEFSGGHKQDTGEYRALPSTVRSSKGLTPDYARETVAEHMPWLKLDTLADFYDYFDRERTYKMRKSA